MKIAKPYPLFLAMLTITVCIALNFFKEADSAELQQISSECLSCHEEFDTPNGGSHSGNHVMGIVYNDYAIGNDKLRPVINLPAELILFDGAVGCETCHGQDPHDGQSLVIDNNKSALCNACHVI